MPMFGLTHKERNGHVASLTQRLNQACQADEIEAMAAVRAIEFAAEIGLDRIVVEGDSKVVTDALKTTELVLAGFGLLVEDA